MGGDGIRDMVFSPLIKSERSWLNGRSRSDKGRTGRLRYVRVTSQNKGLAPISVRRGLFHPYQHSPFRTRLSFFFGMAPQLISASLLFWWVTSYPMPCRHPIPCSSMQAGSFFCPPCQGLDNSRSARGGIRVLLLLRADRGGRGLRIVTVLVLVLVLVRVRMVLAPVLFHTG